MKTSLQDIIEQIVRFSRQPEYKSKEYLLWVKQTEFIGFLKKINSKSHVVLYASAPHLFIYSVLIPGKFSENFKHEDIENWSCDPFSSWGITLSFGQSADIWITPPLENSGSNVLNEGEQLVFVRRFNGRRENQSYVELSQKFSHSIGIHWVPEIEAYCRFDDHGELEEIVNVHTMTFSEGTEEEQDIRIVTIRRDILDEYLVLTNQLFVMLFDSTRLDYKNFTSWNGTELLDHATKPHINFKFGKHGSTESYLRGIQLIKPKLTKKDVYEIYNGDREKKKRKYASFVINDWKNGKVREWTADPKKMGSYFVKSKFPFEISPVFFRSEVLHKYKADTEKYRLSDRSIECKNAWHLKTYDINKAGQVHTYLVYLSQLPYQEQLYWKSFNEAPKGSISKRAYTTDFEGKWDDEYDALHSLRAVADNFPKTKPLWWRLRDRNLLDVLHYPVTASSDEWAKELLTLDKILNEGFELKELRKLAAQKGIISGQDWKSLQFLEEILVKKMGVKDLAKDLVMPLRELHRLRNTMAGHASGKEAKQMKLDVLKKHKTFPNHFKFLCKSCDNSMRSIFHILQAEGN